MRRWPSQSSNNGKIGGKHLFTIPTDLSKKHVRHNSADCIINSTGVFLIMYFHFNIYLGMITLKLLTATVLNTQYHLTHVSTHDLNIQQY